MRPYQTKRPWSLGASWLQGVGFGVKGYVRSALAMWFL